MIKAQSKFSIIPGLFYNGAGFSDEVNGFGLIVGLEYMQRQNHFFSIELRTKYGYYFFDDGIGWSFDAGDNQWNPPKNPGEARVKYSLFSPQIGAVPKFHYHLDETFSLFLENEFSVGLMKGSFEYKGLSDKVNFTEPIFYYYIGAGIEYQLSDWSLLGSIGYSTLNFRDKIRKHQPMGYTGWIPNQSAGLLINVIFKIPL
ncbi:hypothetical protein FACS1894169_13020 [Bacteroidia bacterium]|nr:hypothetical protein FACS1894169_13020 [Bacteroidia bacterium]